MSRKQKPCLVCGGPKPKGPGYVFCSDLCRFLNRAEINPDPQCWTWDGSHGPEGYARMGAVERTGERQMVSAHIVSYELYAGTIPKNKVIHHICGNKGCVNPNHLELITKKEASALGQGSKTHCGTCGRPYSGSNLYLWKKGNRRKCVYCMEQREKSEARQAEKKRYYANLGPERRAELNQRNRLRNKTPEHKAWKKEYRKRPRVKEKEKAYQKAYRQRPEVRKWFTEYQKTYRERKKREATEIG